MWRKRRSSEVGGKPARGEAEIARLAVQEDLQGKLRLSLEFVGFILVALLIVGFAQSVLEVQLSFAEDRVGLMDLRDRWVAVAAGYGLRGDVKASSAEFTAEYRRFRSRPSVRHLLVSDQEFAALASQADLAFVQLAIADLRGRPEAAKAAAFFDEALGRMADQVAVYARRRLEASRGSLLMLAFLLAAATFGFAFLERRLRVTRTLEARSRALTRALISAEEGERIRLARELHDTVAQNLAAAKLYCGLVPGPDAVKAGELLEKAIGEVRELCHGLRPAELDRLGIAEASARLCAEASGQPGQGGEERLEVEFSVEGLEGLALEPETEINLYRILQESLTNVRRHSGASRARVWLRGLAESLELRVEDEGRGPGRSKPGLGRTGMEERARLLGGSYLFGPAPGGGTLVLVRVPLKTKEQA